MIEELQSSNEFLLSVNLSVCLESEEPRCLLQRTIVKHLLITKLVCNWKSNYKIPGTNLNNEPPFSNLVS